MTKPPMRAAILAVAASCLTFAAAPAQGLDRSDRELHPWPRHVRVTSLRVRAEVHDGVASTELDQILHNDSRRDAEATWILPLPPGATADNFTMTVGDKEVAGEVLDAGRARAIYEQIVRQRRDPGLLEYFGDGCLRARVFPIAPGSDVVVKVRFRHVLPRHAGMFTWSFPLRALFATGMRPERSSLDLRLSSSKPLKNVLSPLQGVDILRPSEFEARATLELGRTNFVERDLQILYSLSNDDFGLNCLTYRRGRDAGYFMLVLSPRRDDEHADRAPRFVQFVLDTSGSMAGRKIEQAKGALRFFLRSLHRHDHFNVVPFATEADPFFDGPRQASEDAVAAALAKVDDIQARGGTNIEDALATALAGQASPTTVPAHALPIVVFLTDGAPTVGQTDRDKLVAAARAHNDGKARVFVFGVGNDVDTKLLDRLADDNGGTRDYVREDEDIEVKTSDLFTKLSRPALADLRLTIDGIDVHDVVPKHLPDLFAGSQLTILGRYRSAGPAMIRLSGQLGGERRDFSYDADFAAEATRDDFLPTMWAQRQIAQLLDAIRLNGQRPELMEEVRRLAKTYGIVTPFTSHLIVEEGARLALGDQRRYPPGVGSAPTGAGPRERADAPAAPAADAEAQTRLRRLGETAEGERAVSDSLEIKALELGKDRDRAGSAGRGTLARRIGDRTFFRVGERWIDGACKADWDKVAVRVEAFSAEYFKLLEENPGLEPVLALGTRLVLAIGERVVEIVPPVR
ncbi:MAG: VIT and VWA domain-containing protein [Planctomycetota bacterium]